MQDYQKLSKLVLESFDGEKHIEREHTVYARVSDFSWLESAPEMEVYEDWKLEYDHPTISGRIRLINGRRYTEAIKERMKTEEGCYECEFDISPDAFEMKKKLALCGYRKERYHFPIPNTDLRWEVDVFQSRGGGRSEWIKIDLEYNNSRDAIPEFPFPVEEVIIAEPGNHHVQAQIDTIWNEEWFKLEHNHTRGKV